MLTLAVLMYLKVFVERDKQAYHLSIACLERTRIHTLPISLTSSPDHSAQSVKKSQLYLYDLPTTLCQNQTRQKPF